MDRAKRRIDDHRIRRRIRRKPTYDRPFASRFEVSGGLRTEVFVGPGEIWLGPDAHKSWDSDTDGNFTKSVDIEDGALATGWYLLGFHMDVNPSTLVFDATYKAELEVCKEASWEDAQTFERNGGNPARFIPIAKIYWSADSEWNQLYQLQRTHIAINLAPDGQGVSATTDSENASPTTKSVDHDAADDLMLYQFDNPDASAAMSEDDKILVREDGSPDILKYVDIDDLQDWVGADDYKVKASAGDSTPNYLDGKVAKSVVVSGDKLELDGDESAPGNYYYYGTDGSGNKGFDRVRFHS
jgi:hypothetical protein